MPLMLCESQAAMKHQYFLPAWSAVILTALMITNSHLACASSKHAALLLRAMHLSFCEQAQLYCLDIWPGHQGK